MTVDLMRILSLIFYICGGVFLIISVLLFFFLKIPEVIGNLSGANEKKAIENIKKHNEDAVTHGVGKQTKDNSPKIYISDSGRLVNTTDKLESGKIEKCDATTQLSQQSVAETTVLDKNYTGAQTTLLCENKEKTEELSNTDENGFKLLIEIGFCESDEIIE